MTIDEVIAIIRAERDRHIREQIEEPAEDMPDAVDMMGGDE